MNDEAQVTLTLHEMFALMAAGEGLSLSDEDRANYHNGFQKLLRASQELTGTVEGENYRVH